MNPQSSRPRVGRKKPLRRRSPDFDYIVDDFPNHSPVPYRARYEPDCYPAKYFRDRRPGSPFTQHQHVSSVESYGRDLPQGLSTRKRPPPDHVEDMSTSRPVYQQLQPTPPLSIQSSDIAVHHRSRYHSPDYLRRRSCSRWPRAISPRDDRYRHLGSGYGDDDADVGRGRRRRRTRPRAEAHHYRHSPAVSPIGHTRGASPRSRRRSMPATVFSKGAALLQNPLIQAGARTALTAGAEAAIKSRNDPSPWLGARGVKVATAALGAALVDGFMAQKHPGSMRQDMMRHGVEMAVSEAEKRSAHGRGRRRRS